MFESATTVVYYSARLFMLLAETSLLFYVANKVSKRKVTKLRLGIYFAILIAVSAMLMLVVEQMDICSVLILISWISAYKLCFDVKLNKCIINTFLCFLYIVTTQGLSMIMAHIGWKIFGISSLKLTHSHVIAIVLSKISFVIPYLILENFEKVLSCKQGLKLKKYIRSKYFYIVISLFVNVLSLTIIYYRAISSHLVDHVSSGLLLVSFILLLSNASMLSSVSEILKENKINNEKKLIQKRKTLEYEYYTKIEENNIRIRKLHHDMKNHLLCISGLCEDAKSKEYIAKLTENLSKLDHTVKTGNKVLDIILSEKKQICDEKGIRFDTSVNFSKSDFMDMIDVSAIFHNTIDNAILACEKIPDGGKIEKKIEIKVKYINKFCIIKISNTKVNEIKKKNGRFLTNKKEKESHGFGISNVEDSVRKYGGEMYIEYTDDTFTVNILILTNQIPEREPELAQANN